MLTKIRTKTVSEGSQNVLLRRENEGREAVREVRQELHGVITEFRIPAGKVYLSPIVDCFDGLVVSWTMSTSPNAELANSMLDEAAVKLGPESKFSVI